MKYSHVFLTFIPNVINVGIFPIILTVPKNIIMDLNNVKTRPFSSIMLILGFRSAIE